MPPSRKNWSPTARVIDMGSMPDPLSTARPRSDGKTPMQRRAAAQKAWRSRKKRDALLHDLKGPLFVERRAGTVIVGCDNACRLVLRSAEPGRAWVVVVDDADELVATIASVLREAQERSKATDA